ncbi:MAG: hypothetical protein NTW03_23170 [Verrucomicrobia bacterium]|nr:hypothetical protein [Verrucomicrobiota bacterium]
MARTLTDYGLEKKLYANHPQRTPTPVPTQRTRNQCRVESVDPLSLERHVRQLLAQKISGNLIGLGLLIPEHLRLGTWDLLCGWTGQPTEALAPRLALQLVAEAALCVSGLRHQRSLSQNGFEVAQGLPFIAADPLLHELLAAHTMAQAQALQTALGQIRRASHHFQGRLLALDPHRLKSSSQRQMRRRQLTGQAKPCKVSQTFFCLDADTQQPICFTLGTAARTVAQATPELLSLAQAALYQMRQRVGAPVKDWDARHLAQAWLGGLEGDVRVEQDTMVVTLYNAPNAPAWKEHYEGLPARLQAEHIDPRVPWLYNFKLDFRFR